MSTFDPKDRDEPENVVEGTVDRWARFARPSVRLRPPAQNQSRGASGALRRADGPPLRDAIRATDGRTSLGYELPIEDGTIRALELRQLKTSETDFGLMSYDPAYMNTAACRSSITYVDGDRSALQYRGYSIEQLCEHSSYIEVAYLLINGRLPNKAEFQEWTDEITIHSFLHEDIVRYIEQFRYDANPMGMLVAAVSALSTFYPEANRIEDERVRALQIIRLLANVPTLAAFSFRHAMGLPYVYPDNDLSYIGNFLSMMYKMTEFRYEPDPRLERALDVLFVLHADFEQNASTSAVRMVGSTRVDPYSAVAGGLAALYGPLHGGANEAILRMLARIEKVEWIPDFLESVKAGKERLMGFGHRVFKNYDPRARVIRRHLDAVFEVRGKSVILEIAAELEKRALDDDFFLVRRLYPNLDFYSALIYEALGLPVAMFPVMFAIGRTSGWAAQWKEMLEDPEQRIARPRQIYAGERDREYLPIEQR